MRIVRMKLARHLDMINDSVPLGKIYNVDLDTIVIGIRIDLETYKERPEKLIIDIDTSCPLPFRCLDFATYE